MNRGVRTAIVLVVALVMATVASYALYLAVQQMPVREVEVNSVPVVVASQDLPVGTLLTADHLKVVAWPAGSPVPGAFTEPGEISDRGLIAGIVLNEPVTETKLAPRDFEQLLCLSSDYGVSELVIQPEDWLANKTLGETNLVHEGVTVLGIHRGDGSYLGVPTPETRIKPKQRWLKQSSPSHIDCSGP